MKLAFVLLGCVVAAVSARTDLRHGTALQANVGGKKEICQEVCKMTHIDMEQVRDEIAASEKSFESAKTALKAREGELEEAAAKVKTAADDLVKAKDNEATREEIAEDLQENYRRAKELYEAKEAEYNAAAKKKFSWKLRRLGRESDKLYNMALGDNSDRNAANDAMLTAIEARVGEQRRVDTAQRELGVLQEPTQVAQAKLSHANMLQELGEHFQSKTKSAKDSCQTQCQDALAIFDKVRQAEETLATLQVQARDEFKNKLLETEFKDQLLAAKAKFEAASA